MLWNLLTSSTTPEQDNTGTIIFFAVMIALIALFMFWNRKSQRKREEERNATLDAIQPGNKVKTIGGICGIVVEICPEDGTFILETGSEASGKSYIKFDKNSVYQTDAVAKAEEPVAPIEEVVEGSGDPVFGDDTTEIIEEKAVETEESAE